MARLALDIFLTHCWQIGVLAVAVGIVATIGGRRRPHLAYALWLVVLAKCFVPPLWGWPVNLPGWQPPLTVAATSAASRPLLAGARSSQPSDANLRPPRSSVAEHVPVNADLVPARKPSERVSRVVWGIIAVWALGVAFLVGRTVGRGGERARLLRRTSQPAPESVQRALSDAARTMQIRRCVPVYSTSTNVGPGAVGICRPAIYVPQHLIDRMSPAELRTVMAHELAHVRRGDAWIAQLQAVAQIIWWFHPLVWWMNRELARQRERCCDEEVVASLDGNRGQYARCLVSVLEAKLSLEPLWGRPGVRPAELTRRRLEEIMKRPNMNCRRSPSWCGLVAVGFALAVLPMGGTGLIAQNPDRPDEDRQFERQANDDVTATSRAPRVLKYGDGEADGKKSIAGAGEMIRFTLPEGIDGVRALRIHCARYGYPQPPDEDVEITFLNEDMTESLHTEFVPYSLFKRTRENRWTTVPFDEPVELPRTFWVVLNFNAERTKGVYVSYDTDTKGKHSRVGFTNEDAKETDFNGDWMVQVLLPRR